MIRSQRCYDLHTLGLSATTLPIAEKFKQEISVPKPTSSPRPYANIEEAVRSVNISKPTEITPMTLLKAVKKCAVKYCCCCLGMCTKQQTRAESYGSINDSSFMRNPKCIELIDNAEINMDEVEQQSTITSDTVKIDQMPLIVNGTFVTKKVLKNWGIMTNEFKTLLKNNAEKKIKKVTVQCSLPEEDNINEQ
ncbi:unnamed protein product [Caenorhabditis bovis]|uniref:Uncharacterized protein n=1 Tax=Caenorhabditis bovis TaxID=2654633 RepID=A0A8S1EFV7_9PELO|nr:unnamed protein product [Caenorhabditis bovis]